MNKLSWLEILYSVYPELIDFLKHNPNGYGVCTKHFQDVTTWRGGNKKCGVESMNSAWCRATKGPNKQLLELQKKHYKCCIPGCQEYTRIRVFDPSWIDIPKQVFRNFKLRQRHNFICVDHFDQGNWSLPSLNKLIEYRNGYLKRFLTAKTEEDDEYDKNDNQLRISDTKNTPEKQVSESKKLKLDYGKFYSTPEKLPGFPEPLRTSTPYSKP